MQMAKTTVIVTVMRHYQMSTTSPLCTFDECGWCKLHDMGRMHNRCDAVSVCTQEDHLMQRYRNALEDILAYDDDDTITDAFAIARSALGVKE